MYLFAPFRVVGRTAFFICGVFCLLSSLEAQRPSGVTPPSRGTPNFSFSQRSAEGAFKNVPRPTVSPAQRLASPGVAKIQKDNRRESCLLRSSRIPGSTDIVEIGLEGVGEIHRSGGEESSRSVSGKMEVVAGFRYEERTAAYRVGPESIELESLRQYDQAGMKRNFDGSVDIPLLDSTRKHMISRYDGKILTQYSPAGALKSDQFLLIDELPANTLLLDLLLPNREVRLGDEWTLSNETLCALLGWDAVENNTVRLVLTAMIDDMAEVHLFLGDAGMDKDGNPLPSTLQGASMGAPISADLQGVYQFDLKSNRMTWFGLSVTEQRGESLVEPGLDWKATVRIRIAPLSAPNRLTDDVVQQCKIEPTPERLDLVYNGKKGPWGFRHSRAWRMIEDSEQSAALIFVSKGEGVAQCNILSNGQIDRATIPSMDEYKEELKKGLGERFGRFVTDSVYRNDFNDDILAVMIDGQFEEIPFRWLYYLITDAAGHQVTVMFEIRADKLQEYGDSGREIVDTFRLIFPEDEKIIQPLVEPESENDTPAAEPKETAEPEKAAVPKAAKPKETTEPESAAAGGSEKAHEPVSGGDK